MTVGLATAHAHAIINIYRATAYSAVTPFLQLHTGDPGASGTANVSAVGTRMALTFAAPSAGASSASQVSWPSWAAGNETITHFSIHGASSSGTFYQSGAFSASKAVSNGDTLNATVSVSYTPLAA